jgi:glucose/arabinose dehydrogenase
MAAEIAAPEPAKAAQNEEIKPQTSEAAPATPRKSTTEPASETKTLTSPAQRQTLTEATVIAAAKPKQAPAEAEPTKSSSQTIAVVVEINEGHVTEAYVKTPQHGMAAYEATALRLARQRRFPKGTNRRETINLQVTRER